MSTPIAPDPMAAVRAARAAHLRHLAALIQGLRLLDLHLCAGSDVWVGPVASRCHDELTLHRRQLLFAADGLRAAARRLEHG